MNNEQRIINWFIKQSMNAYQYQVEVGAKLLNSEWAKLLLAGVPNFGKTLMAACIASLKFEDKSNIRILFLTHNTGVLRDNVDDQFKDLRLDFKYQVLKREDDFDSTANMVICLPATINQRDILPQFDLVIIDEAHEYYGRKKGDGLTMVQRIIERVGATQQLLLTGSPSSFVNDDTFYKEFVSGIEVYDAGNSAEVITEIDTSSFLVKEKDFNRDGDIRYDYHFDGKIINYTLDDLMMKIEERVKTNFVTPTHHKLRVLDKIFGKWEMPRTMIACRNISAAKKVYQYFKKRNINVVLSTKDDDTDDVITVQYKRDQTQRVLVVVRKGVLGYNDPSLEYVIDMTLSTNIDRIFQLWNRATRKNGDNKKHFIKIVPSTEVDFYRLRMCGVLSLIHPYNFRNFNGTNFNDLRIPVKRKKTTGGGSGTGGTRKKTSKTYFEELDCMDPIDMFNFLTSKESKLLSPDSWIDMGTLVNKLNEYHGKKHMNTVTMIEEFYESNAGGYLPELCKDLTKKSIVSRAKRIGIHDDLVKKYKMKVHQKLPDGFWTTKNKEATEYAIELAIKHTSISDMRKESSAAVKYLREHNMIHDYFKPAKIYTEQDIIKAAKKCSDFTEFQKKYPSHCNKARKLGIVYTKCGFKEKR